MNSFRSEQVTLVTKWKEVLTNIKILERARVSKPSDEFGAYADLIKKGTCFVVYGSHERIGFAPSKFVGYASNKLSEHSDKQHRDGRETNRALRAIIGRAPESNRVVDSMYRRFCSDLGFQPNKKGTFGAPRKFWVSDEAYEVVDSSVVEIIQNDQSLSATEKQQLVKARVGQGQFRKGLIELWGGCCLTGCTANELLRASHIKPWSAGDNRERLDPYNGLLLTPNADSLFDRGYITFSDDGVLIISKRLSPKARTALLAGCDKRIPIRENNRPYLEYHRSHRFLDSVS